MDAPMDPEARPSVAPRWSVRWPLLRPRVAWLVAVFMAAWLGLTWPLWPLVPTSSCWPAAGVGMAALLVCGWQAWPVVWLGQGVAGWIWVRWTGQTGDELGGVALLTAASLAALQAGLGARCVTHWGWWPTRMRSGARLSRLLAWAVLMSLINPGILSLAQAAVAGQGGVHAVEQWGLLSLSEALGMVLLMPLALLWAQPGAWRQRRCVWVSGLTLCGLFGSVVAARWVAHEEVQHAQDHVHHQAEGISDVLRQAWSELEMRLRLQKALQDLPSSRLQLQVTAKPAFASAAFAPPLIRFQRTAEEGGHWLRRPVAATTSDGRGAWQAVNTTEAAALQAAWLSGSAHPGELVAWTVGPGIPAVRGDSEGGNGHVWWLGVLIPPDQTSPASGAPQVVAAALDGAALNRAVVTAWLGLPAAEASTWEGLHVRLSWRDGSGREQPLARVAAPAPMRRPAPDRPPHWLHDGGVPHERLSFQQGGGAWVLDLGGDADFWARNPSHWPGAALAAGLALTALLMGLALVATGRHELLEAQVAKATVELDQSLLLLEDAVEGYQAQSQQLKLVLRSTPAGFLAFDAEGQVAFANAALAAMLALDEDVLSGLSRQAVTDHLVAQCPADAAVADRLLADDGHEPGRPVRLRVMRGTEVLRVLEVTRSSVSDAQLRSVFLVADVSEAVQLERSKTQFIANIAHEIRTPLTSISGYAQLLLRHAQGDPARRDTMLRELLTMSGRLNALMGSMLDLAELETVGAVGLERQPTDLAALVTETLGRFPVPEPRDPPVWQPPSDGPICLLNPRKVALAVRHLLANAYAFSVAPGRVWVGLMVEGADGPSPHAVLTVTDQGIGMTAEQLAQAFERFYRADTSGEKPGFGLGLAIVRLVVELHQGQVGLSSKPGQGTQVTVLLPLAPPAAPAHATPPA